VEYLVGLVSVVILVGLGGLVILDGRDGLEYQVTLDGQD
jgi:hypothetical protein